ncbi:hypothetical protein FHS34_006525 [Streptomyces echinatus]|uniref:Uncharacterized protein n=1 Tax=Streptomyces echinatus TaxID=67293 RepID=A0A7W9Q0V6_9ACTN|nr:hypothetical protein [Streptomyces echinatus]
MEAIRTALSSLPHDSPSDFEEPLTVWRTEPTAVPFSLLTRT